MASGRPSIARPDLSGPAWLSSAHAKKAVSPAGPDVAAAQRLNRCPPVERVDLDRLAERSLASEKILAMTLVPAAALSTFTCVQASRKRPPDNGTSVGQEDRIRLALVAAKWILAKAPLGFEHARLRDCRVEAGLAIERAPDMRDDEPAGIERGHGGLGHIQRRRLLGADRSARIENLEVNEQRPGKTRPPCDDDISVGKAGDHRDPVQAGDRIGAKLGTIFRSVDIVTLRADALVCRLSAQTTMKPPSGSARQRRPYQRFDFGGADLAFRSRKRIRVECANFELRRRPRQLLDPCGDKALARFNDGRELTLRPRRSRKVDDEFAVARNRRSRQATGL